MGIVNLSFFSEMMGIVNLSFFSEMMIFVGLVWIPVRIQGLKCVGAGADCNEAKRSCKFIWDGAEWAADPPEDGCDTKTTQEADTANAACDGAFDKATNICYFHESDTPNQKKLSETCKQCKKPHCGKNVKCVKTDTSCIFTMDPNTNAWKDAKCDKADDEYYSDTDCAAPSKLNAGKCAFKLATLEGNSPTSAKCEPKCGKKKICVKGQACSANSCKFEFKENNWVLADPPCATNAPDPKCGKTKGLGVCYEAANAENGETVKGTCDEACKPADQYCVAGTACPEKNLTSCLFLWGGEAGWIFQYCSNEAVGNDATYCKEKGKKTGHCYIKPSLTSSKVTANCDEECQSEKALVEPPPPPPAATSATVTRSVVGKLFLLVVFVLI